MSEKVEKKANLPVVYSILDKNADLLVDIWIDELEKHNKIDDAYQIKREAGDFINTVLSVLKEGVFPILETKEIQAMKRITEVLHKNAECFDDDLSCTTNYLMSLKTAFFQFLQKLQDGSDKTIASKEIKSFAALLDLLGVITVQQASEDKDAMIKSLQESQLQSFVDQQIIGKSKIMEELFEKIKIVMNSEVTVLIEGGSGVGKELVAEAIHYGSHRKDQPFIAVNCAAIPENLLESELFGYEKGAFTGADMVKIGKVEAANGGTLFLDEIGEMSLAMQAKILRVLQKKEITRLGGNFPLAVDVRFISATNKNLFQQVSQGKFREDLYYRLSVFPIEVPVLSKRKEDIPLLADYFLKKELSMISKDLIGFDDEAIAKLIQYDYPGNIRELENVIKRAVLMAKDNIIHEKDIMFFGEKIVETINEESLASLAELEKDLINQRIDYYNGNISQAAKSLGLTRATIYKKIKE